MNTRLALLMPALAVLLTLFIGCPVEPPSTTLYTVTFYKNDALAVGSTATLSLSTSASANLSPCGFLKSGSTFAGWSTTPTGPVAYGDGALYTMGSANVILYAQWVANGYSIYFMANDPLATGAMPAQVVSSGAAASLNACAFAKPGWTFAGWSTSPASAIAYLDNALITMGASDLVLYAQWTANLYTISFDKNDVLATGTMANQTIACGSFATLTLNAFTKAGSTFAGWATSPSGTVAFGNGASYTMGTEDVTLYARWVANGYTITFDKNDPLATGSMPPQTISSGSSAALTLNAFGKPGWSFAGWAASAGGSVAYADGANYTMGTSNVTLFAKWTANNYTITFDKNDSAAVGTMSQQSIACGSSAALTGNAFYKPGWSFAGWAATSDGTVAYNDGASYTMGSANVTLYAKWTADNYTITFDKNDSAATGTMSQQTIASGSSAALIPNAFTKSGSAFAGWATAPLGAVVFGDGALYAMGSSSVTLYAKWAANSYSVTFEKNDALASGTMSPQVIASGASANLTLNTFTKPGWTFAGWAATSGGVVAYNDGASYTMGSANVTLYAQWTANNYTITFDKNDSAATGTMSQQTIASGASANLTLCAFSKSGWLFAGWAVTSSGVVVYPDGANYMMGSASVTLYAKWTSNTFTVIFDKNDSTAVGSMTPLAIENGATAALTLNAFYKPGWTFAGWATTSGGSVAYNDGANYTMGGANVTLYAQWTANNYTITFDKNSSAATGTMAIQTIASGSFANLTLNAFVRTGWTFAGWATTSGGTVAYSDGANYPMGTVNVTLYAKWTANNYTVTFDKNDAAATGTMSQQTIACGSTASLTSNAFTKPGWSFSGWATTPGGSTFYSNSGSYTMGSANVTLYAKWAAIEYSITYNKNDTAATGTMSQQFIDSGSTANLISCTFAKTGWMFAGWATTSGGSVAYANGASYTMGSSNVTLYATWTANNYVITFDKNDAAASGTMSQQTIASGSTASLSLNAYSKTGWTFAGWATTSGGAVAYNDGASYTMGTANVTLFAKWTPPNYTVTFDKNDTAATGTMASQAIASGSTSILNICTFSKPGWTMSGWAATPNGSVVCANGGAYTMGASDVTLYAKWSANLYKITFDKNDAAATGTMSQQYLNSGSSASLYSCSFSKPNWTFTGWATTPSGAVAYTNMATFTMGTSDVTLYATWAVTNYSITFNKNDAAAYGSMANQAIPFGSTAALIACTFVKDGWSFAGWATTSGGAIEYADGASYTMGGANVTLYAKWTVNYYLINFDKNDMDATGYMSAQSIASGSTAALNSCAYTKTGWSFKNWTSGPTGGMIYNNGANYTMGTADVAIFAHWQINQYTVTFDSQGGSSVSPRTVTYGNPVSEPSVPMWTGYAFVAWYREPACVTPWNFATDIVSGNVTLYAKWLVATSGLQYSIVNGTYIVYKGTADTNGAVYVPAYWAGKKVTSIGSNAFSDCTTMTNIELPDGITTISDAAFYNCSALTIADLPGSLTAIGVMAFDGCSALNSITIPYGVTSIGASVFSVCTSLTTVTLPAGITTIGNDAFAICNSLTSINIPEGVTSIGLRAFNGCSSLPIVIFPSTLTSIGEMAFSGCSSLTQVNIPAGMTVINDDTFYGCTNLTSVTIPNGVTTIGSNAFYQCSKLNNIVLPDTVTTIGTYAFLSCTSLTSITLSNGLTLLGAGAIRLCPNLTTLTLPSNINSIGNDAFMDDTKLTTVIVNPTTPPVAGTTIFSGCSALTAIRVPAGTVAAYQAAAGWSTYSGKIVSQ